MRNIFFLCKTTNIKIALLLLTLSCAHLEVAIAKTDQTQRTYTYESEKTDDIDESEQVENEYAEKYTTNELDIVFHNRINQKIGPSAITWKANGGRFGDNLVSYSKAKWMSLTFDIPLLYLPFPYSDELMIHENEEMYTLERHEQFAATVQLLKKPSYVISKNNNTLYVCRWKTDIVIDWCDQNFVAEIKKHIAPRYELEKVIIPEGYVSIAAHVRNGGTFAADTPEEKERCPLRFVPEEFFIDQIERLTLMFPEDNLYVYIFTDHPEPEKLACKFKKALNNPRITFDYRKSGNSHKSNVLEDFFSMMDFDCLIRPGSHFSRFVQRLGNNKVVIYPESVKEIAPGKRVIDTIKIKTRTNVDEKWKTQDITIA